jgi:hypothetical protein
LNDRAAPFAQEGTAPTDASLRGVGSSFERARPALARLAFLAVLTHAFFLPISLPGVQIGIGVALFAVAVAALGGARPFRTTGLEVPLLLLAAASLVATVIPLATGMSFPGVEAATRWKALLSPLVIVPALFLGVPGEDAGAPRRRALAAVAAWGAGAAVASTVGIVQATLGIDLLHVVGYRKVPLLPDVPYWPGHFAAVGFFPWYPQYAHNLVSGLAFAAGLALAARVSTRWRVAVGTAAAMATLATALTVSRAAWGGLVVVAIALLVLSSGGVRRRAIPALVAALAAVTLLHPGLRIRLSGTLGTDVNHNRLLFGRVCSDMWRDHPLGVGVGNFTGPANAYFEALIPGYPVRTGCHLTPLSLLVEGGPLLLGATLVAAFLIVRAVLRWRARGDETVRAAAAGAIAALAGFAANGLFHDVHRESHAMWPLGFALGIAAVLAHAPAPGAAVDGADRSG